MKKADLLTALKRTVVLLLFVHLVLYATGTKNCRDLYEWLGRDDFKFAELAPGCVPDPGDTLDSELILNYLVIVTGLVSYWWYGWPAGHNGMSIVEQFFNEKGGRRGSDSRGC